jgi:alcohol dehydrogenase (cytochrome c)
MRNKLTLAALIALALATFASAQVTYERILNSRREPQQWLTYSGTYDGQRYSSLDQINRSNVSHLGLAWAFQTNVRGKMETTPLVIDGIMYLSGSLSHAWALDVRTGRPLWHYNPQVPEGIPGCCGPVNRGLAALGDKIFLATYHAHVVALDSKTGNVLWDVESADATKGYTFTLAPLVVKDKVIVGVAGGEYGIRGYLEAYDADTGKRAWRLYTIPAAGEPGSETWSGDSWKTGGSPAWVTGTYDAALNTLYWGTGNPGPQVYGLSRVGDNLYSDSVLAIDPDTGKLKWHFQFTPHDTHDWDSTQVPVLFDSVVKGQPRKLLGFANRNGFFYLLDRTNGKFILAKPYTKVTWAKEIGSDGRPVLNPNTEPTAEGNRVCPGGIGGTNWHSPSYSPQTKLFYALSAERCATFTADEEETAPLREGRLYIGSAFFSEQDEEGSSSLVAIDPLTGEKKWAFKQIWAWSGVTSTAGGLVFSGDDQGNFFALDAVTGKDLWHIQLGGRVAAAPMTFAIDGKQYVSVAVGGSLFTFTLNDLVAPTKAPVKKAALKK